jgi:hypothetical protein
MSILTVFLVYVLPGACIFAWIALFGWFTGPYFYLPKRKRD